MTLVESMKVNKEAYNTAVDSVIAQINATRATTNTNMDASIDQMTRIAVEFPASLIAPITQPS